MKSYPLAIIAPRLGTMSETFIGRHMVDLLPGRTVVVVRTKDPHIRDQDIPFPYLLPSSSDLNWRLFYNGILEIFNLNKISPIQRTVEEYLKNNHTRIVLSEYLDMSIRWLDIAKKLGIRFYAHAHGYDVSRTLRNKVMCRRYLRLEKADGIITMSEYSRKKLMGIGLSGDNILVIPYGINVPDAPLIRQGGDIIRCLAVGRMVAKKAPLLTLEAFRLALMRNQDLQLDYIGDGELFDKARQFVEGNSLSNSVTLHGRQPNSTVQEFMKRADIFLQHSRTDPSTGDEEGLPVGILEAMANGLPIVSTRHAGIPEAVIENATGYLVDEGDVHGMAAHIVQLAKNVELRKRFSRDAWARAKQHFSWDNEKSALLKLFGL